MPNVITAQHACVWVRVTKWDAAEAILFQLEKNI